MKPPMKLAKQEAYASALSQVCVVIVQREILIVLPANFLAHKSAIGAAKEILSSKFAHVLPLQTSLRGELGSYLCTFE